MPSPVNSVHQTTAQSSTPVPAKDIETQKDRKTVLESHGYYLAKTIGSGSYATVRVNKILRF